MDYSELASLFPNLYKETKMGSVPVFPRSALKNEIPKILHYIWLGKKPLSEEFKQNISHFSAHMRKLGGISVLWTDQPESSFQSWLKGVQLVDVDSVFGSRKSMATFCHYKASLAKIPANFGEAGDLLRYEVIDRFGGYYFDCDIMEKEMDLSALLALGETSPFGFVAGYCPLGDFCRNDLFGAVAKGPIMDRYKDLVLSNYQTKVWNRRLTYSRPFLLDFTILTTGPDAFKETVEQFIDKENKDVFQRTYVLSTKDYSAESWVYDHTNPKPIRFFNDEERHCRIKHDLMLNLIYHEQILDLEKYQTGEPECLLSLVEELVVEHPGLAASVDRIFIGDVQLYCRLKEVLEAGLKKKIVWNEPAVLKFACTMKKGDLIGFLVDEREVNLSEAVFADVGYYENLMVLNKNS